MILISCFTISNTCYFSFLLTLRYLNIQRKTLLKSSTEKKTDLISPTKKGQGNQGNSNSRSATIKISLSPPPLFQFGLLFPVMIYLTSTGGAVTVEEFDDVCSTLLLKFLSYARTKLVKTAFPI